MTKDFSLKKHFTTLAVLVAIFLALDFATPGLDLLGFKFGRMATASLMIDYGRGATRQFTGEVVNKMSVFDALIASSKSGLKVDYIHNGRDLTFLSIDGRSGAIKVKINNETIPVENLNQTMVTQGDLISIELP
ncbi:MAG: hypothetical protein A3C71_02445 [Candidatus Yanofskybacteria bacterium RIFCSPHIGHO2_02_FULL_43_15c]|uniref:Uncharacterized protein n=2 Tax=Candidatus Yanofskyibacteriota TaxID=1752733 RepID=A0A1F8GZ31_9BACT|nr:MAG: hypothetical protein A3C71_02445 [Candidatus Yanofskybacteria bacterium RIFCSPHIGHO2_02_FULL_43_15c]OGN30682.1 MAG: hypothetical protein A3I92_01340 [Candidatus Yanofskybacteria bacterium RIFCSPLOWO2_02_FULL_43_10b]